MRWQKSRQMSTAGGDTTLMHRVNGSLCGGRRTPEVGMKEGVWDRGRKGIQVNAKEGTEIISGCANVYENV